MKIVFFESTVDEQSSNNSTKCDDCKTVVQGAKVSCKDCGSNKVTIKFKR